MSRRDRSPGAAEGAERPTAEYLVVAAAVAVVLLAAGGVAATELFLDTGESLEANVQAGASVASSESAGTVTVTWTSNQNAEHLLVGFARGGEAMQVTEGPDGAETTGGRVVLSAVGESVTFAERRGTATPAPGQSATPRTVEVIVTAVHDDGDGTPDDADTRTVIVRKEVDVRAAVPPDGTT